MAENTNVCFLRGTQANLNNLTTSDTGTFYLTDDSHELYIGLGEGKKPVALNRYVDIYENWEAISKLTDIHSGKFYYAEAENILCVYNGSKWTQINPDTDTKLSRVEISAGEIEIENKGTDNESKSIKYSLKFYKSDINGAELTGEQDIVKAELVINQDMVTSLVTDVNVNVEASVSNNVATIKTSGAGSAGDGFAITGGDNITVGGSEDAITIEAVDTTYTLASNGTKIELKNNSEEAAGAVEFIDDDKWVAVSNDNGNIKIAHIGSDSAKETASSSTTRLEDEDTFKVITGLTIEKGHVTGYNTTEYQIQDTITTVDGSIETKDGVNQLKLATKEENGNDIATDYIDISSTLTVNGTDYTI